jgi:hypothetical protein
MQTSQKMNATLLRDETEKSCSAGSYKWHLELISLETNSGLSRELSETQVFRAVAVVFQVRLILGLRNDAISTSYVLLRRKVDAGALLLS